MANYTRNERIDFHLNQAKKGAVGRNGKPLSDFARGKHANKAEQLIAQKDNWIERNREKLSATNLKKHDAAKKRRKKAQQDYIASINGGNK